MPTGEVFYPAFIQTLMFNSAFINYNQGRNHWIGPASIVLEIDRAYDCNILAIGFINKKLINIHNEEITPLEGTLQERFDVITSTIDIPKININDYLEPITEEEFYNIKPE